MALSAVIRISYPWGNVSVESMQYAAPWSTQPNELETVIEFKWEAAIVVSKLRAKTARYKLPYMSLALQDPSDPVICRLRRGHMTVGYKELK